MKRTPAIWWWGRFDPGSAKLGHLVAFNDEGVPVVQVPGGERELLDAQIGLSLRAECPKCGEWTAHLDSAGEHYLGCLETRAGA